VPRLAVASVALMLACGPAPDPLPSGEAVAGAGTCQSTVPGLPAAIEQIDVLLAARLQAEAIPGLAAGIVCGSEPIWSQGYGVMALHDARPVTERTRFRIASITKVFTATVIMKLVEDGALTLGDPVRRHLGWFDLQRPPGIGDVPITIRQILTHTSGLPRDSRLTDFRRRYQPDREAAIKALPAQSVQTTPGGTMAYSNLGYGVLGEIIAEASGMSYGAYLEEAIVTPLGMYATLVHPAPDDDGAWGHGPRPLIGSRPKAGFWELGFATPAGGMASTVEDLASFIVLNLAPYTGIPTRVVAGNVLKEMHTVQHWVDAQRGGMGLGWAVETSNGQHVIYHGGELPEQTSFLLIDLRTHVGIIVLTNAEDADASGMAQEILRMIRGAVLPAGTSYPARAIPPGPP
jgi:CubicO group peptidase (beta-lactamase class C family)